MPRSEEIIENAAEVAREKERRELWAELHIRLAEAAMGTENGAEFVFGGAARFRTFVFDVFSIIEAGPPKRSGE